MIRALLIGLALALPAGAAPSTAAASRVRIDYVVPRAAAMQEIYRDMKGRRVLEGLRDILSVVRLPRPLTLRLSECGSEANAWYAPETRSVTVCYEYIQDMHARAPQETSPTGVTRHEAIVGPIAQVFLHETGHALFHLLDVPVLGREEDAADQFAALVLLRLRASQARPIIDGSAFLMGSYAREETADREALADDHGLVQQRLYNLLCLAYGSDRRAFRYLVERGDLPEERARGCAAEHDQAAFALDRLFRRHLQGGRIARDRVRRGFRWAYR
ncbi:MULTISPECIES: DUF4344 domain-containing metallopeptidase [Methylobacterium]|uniref:DUF4344 domain-containing metallopeptidase n=1 Tax=Methylobacterium TaxID=407 RepID=UPI001043608C|nr:MULTISPECIES: DUF4344 domain-containing metallopeptidase [Methylobacterium]MDR7039579.1 hypothetical protein [Methylobacterium sp. BE186]